MTLLTPKRAVLAVAAATVTFLLAALLAEKVEINGINSLFRKESNAVQKDMHVSTLRIPSEMSQDKEQKEENGGRAVKRPGQRTNETARAGERDRERTIETDQKLDQLAPKQDSNKAKHNQVMAMAETQKLERVAEDTERQRTNSDKSYVYREPPGPPLPLPTPVLVLGMPKTGTATIADFFRCNKNTIAHYTCRGQEFCGTIIHDNVLNGRPPLHDPQLNRTAFQVYAQLDYAGLGDLERCYFPQVENLNEIHRHYPNATLILNTRDEDHWVRSVKSWNNMMDRLTACNITGMPAGVGGPEAMKTLYRSQVEKVRNLAKDHPSHTLIEVDIESKEARNIMADAFGASPDCWGHSHQVNTNSGHRR